VGGPRQQLEQRVRVQFERIVRQRLGLTDAQMAQLRASNQRFAPERRALNVRERQIRQSIRAELQPGGTPDETRVASLTDSLFALQRQRLDMLQSEQRELGTFLSPSQRVRYYALQEQLRRRVEAMQRMRLGGPAVQ
jgi:LTXXQ motif family protein